MIILFSVLGLFIFDPAATERALTNPQGRDAALSQLMSLNPSQRARVSQTDLTRAIGALANDKAASIRHRVKAIRVIALLGEGAGSLVDLVTQTDSPESTAVAREAARALRQLGMAGALRTAVTSPDPEIRASAAAAGAGTPEVLCMLLKDDPWPIVRVAAAQGLVQHPEAAVCLKQAFNAGGAVALAAIESAASLEDPRFKESLRAIAGDAKYALTGRVEAVVALAHLGDREPADRIMATHLSSGGIEPLTMAALRAFAVFDDRPAIRMGMTSKSPQVQVTAARILIRLRDMESMAQIRALYNELPRRPARALRDELDRQGLLLPSADPAESDPE